MPNRLHRPHPSFNLLLAFVGALLVIVLALATTVAAQDGAAEATPPPATTEFDFTFQPTFAAPTAVVTLDPQMLPSLTGVGGQAANASVVIRSGPGLQYSRISYLKRDGWIDIVGWNGWDEGRNCSADFESDLDMWVEVQFGERRGWIARCVLDIRGQLTKLPIVTASGERILQQ